MNLYFILFYIIAGLIFIATAFAISQRNLVYAVIYLVLSFFGTAMLFYLLGAPFLAALEIIIYAGAIMVLFLFIIMMMPTEKRLGHLSAKSQRIPAMMISALYLAAFVMLAISDPGGWKPMAVAQAHPKYFGMHLFNTHWLSIEIASMLLLVALIGTIVLGQKIKKADPQTTREKRLS